MSTTLNPEQRDRVDDDRTAPATQLVRNVGEYLGQGEIGQRVGPDRFELFVSVEPALALGQILARHRADYIALHDVGGSVGLRLLRTVATATRTQLQQLAVRRQGQGVPLATLSFVEFHGHGGKRLRVYSTDLDADMNGRREIGRVLMANAKLVVLLVGELPSHALATALRPLADAMLIGPWANRELQVVPVGNAPAPAERVVATLGHVGPTVTASPPAKTPNEIWSGVTSAWNRVTRGAPGAPAAAAAPSSAAAPAGRKPPDVSPAPLERYLQACLEIKGVQAAALFDHHQGRMLAQGGGPPDPKQLAQQMNSVLAAAVEAARRMLLSRSEPEITMTLGGHHLMLHPVPGRPGMALHLVLDAARGNPTLAHLKLARIDVEYWSGGR